MKTKTTHTNQIKIRGAAFAALALGVLALLPGCASQDENPTGTGTTQLSLNVAGIADANPDTSTTRAMLAPETVNQVQEDGTVLSFTLTPDARSTTRATSIMTTNNTYKFVVLDGSGNIVGSVDGKAGTASPTVAVTAGTAYTLAAYSYNNTSTVPSPGTVGGAPNPVAWGGTTSSNPDLLYWKESYTPVGTSADIRPVTFSHESSKVTVVIDASSMGASVSGLSGVTLEPNYGATMAVATGALTKSGSSTTVPVSFATTGTTVTATPVTLFSNGEALTLKFGGGTIGAKSLAGKSVSFARALQPGVSYTLTVNAHHAIPADIILAQNRIYFVASVYDQDYVPYTTPTALATTTRPVAADGTPDPTVDVQGKITTAGVTVQIPLANVPTGSGTVPAYSTTATVPASLTEDGNGRTLTLSWASQPYTTSTTYITATIKAVGSDLLAKKLDINAGIGNDYLGILLGQFTYPYNSAGNTTTYQVRDIAPIPDKKYGRYDLGNTSTYEHNFLYIPVKGEDGNIWLNNNLGADYSNVNSASFNPGQQATAPDDYHAYGSMFQWGRQPDGHELMNWTGSTAGTPVYGTTPGLLSEPLSSASFITVSSGDWRTPPDDALWAAESSTNNPCPSGFRVPTDNGTTASDFGKLISDAGITNSATAWASSLKFSVSGVRDYVNGLPYGEGSEAYYWSSSSYLSFISMNRYFGSFTIMYGNDRAYGNAVRCIKN